MSQEDSDQEAEEGTSDDQGFLAKLKRKLSRK